MAADGRITIDFDMDLTSIKSDADRANEVLHGIGSNAGDKMDEKMSENTEKVKLKAKKASEEVTDDTKNAGKSAGDSMSKNFGDNADKVKEKSKETKQSVDNDFSKETKVKLVADAQTAGIKNFETILQKLPKKQQIELLAKVNRGEIVNYEELLRKIPAKVATQVKLNDNASSGLKSIQRETQQTESRFGRLKDVMLGTFAGGLALSGIHAIVSGLKEATQAGMEYNKEQDTMKTVWTALTTEAPKDGKELINYINSMSQHSIYAADTIDKMAQSFYHVHSSVSETKDWTNAFIRLGSTLHMSNDALAESGEQFAKIVAGGKASSEDMSVMINRFPMFGEALQKATGKSMQQLYAMSAAGKLSATQFTEALDYLSKKYKSGTDEAMTSFQGMSMYISSRWQTLWGDITSTSFKMSKKSRQDIRDLLSDDMMKEYAQGISAALGSVFVWVSKVLGYINDHKKTIVDIVGNLIELLGIIGKSAWDLFADTIYDIAKMFGLVDENGKKTVDPLKKIDEVLQALVDHKAAVQDMTKALIAMFAIKKIVDFIKYVKEATVTLGLFQAAESATGAKDAIGQIGSALGGLQGKLGTALNSNLGKITVGIAFAYNFADVVKDIGVAFGKGGTVDEKFKSIGQVSGFGIGTGIGMFFGGPAGAALGGTIGKFIGKYVGETVEDLQKKYSSDNASNSDMASSGGKKTYTETTRKGAGIKDSDSTSTKIIKGAEFGLSNAGMALNARALMNTASKIFGNGAGWKKSIGKSLGQIDTSFSKWVSGFGKSAKKTWQKITKSSLAINSPRWNDITKSFDKWFKGFGKSAKKTWQKITKSSLAINSPRWNDITKSFDKWFKGFGKTWNKSWNKLGDFGSTISRSASKSWDDITKSFTKWQGGFKKTWDKDWSKLADFGDGIKKGASDTWSDITKSLGKWYKGFSKDWDKDWNELGNYLSGKTGDMRQTLNGWGSGVDKWWKKFSTGFGKSWNSCWQSASDFFGNIFGGIANTAKSAMDGVIGVLNGGIGGIDSVIHTFGGSKSAIPKIHKLANGTTNGQLDKDTLAVLNDGNDSPETNNREMVRKANGQSYLVNGINTLAKLDKGDTVYSASQTRDLLGLRHFAGGSILDTVSGAVDWAGDKLGDAEKYLGDKMEAIKKFIKDPVKAVTGVFDKTIGSLAGNAELIKDLAPAEGHWMIGKGKKWFEDLFKKLNTEFENPGGSGVARWKPYVQRALAMLGLSGDLVDKVLSQINTESGGNPKAMGGTDGLSDGHAMGLMQVKPGTFKANMVAGHGDVWNGFDNILAGLNYAQHRYGKGLSFLGHGHGYANGGWSFMPAIFGEVPGEPELAINPARDTADEHILQAIQARASKAPNSTTAQLAQVIENAKDSGQVAPIWGQRASQNIKVAVGDNSHDYTGHLDNVLNELDVIANKSLEINGHSFSKKYEAYGSARRVQRTQQARRGLAINVNI